MILYSLIWCATGNTSQL